ncbi:hypothetical protein ACP4OV_029153 [Aristida adscensionis]
MGEPTGEEATWSAQIYAVEERPDPRGGGAPRAVGEEARSKEGGRRGDGRRGRLCTVEVASEPVRRVGDDSEICRLRPRFGASAAGGATTTSWRRSGEG